MRIVSIGDGYPCPFLPRMVPIAAGIIPFDVGCIGRGHVSRRRCTSLHTLADVRHNLLLLFTGGRYRS